MYLVLENTTELTSDNLIQISYGTGMDESPLFFLVSSIAPSLEFR